jgi:competence protein ComEC
MIKRKYWSKIAAGIVLLYAGFVWAFLQLPDGKMHVWFLDVGQGDAILIQTPGGANVLIDGGPGREILEKLADKLPFFNKEIDLMILTHPHSDHLNGLVEVLRKYKVDSVMMTGIEYNNSYYEEFLGEVCLMSGVNGGFAAGSDEMLASGHRMDCPSVFIAQASQDFKFGDVYFDIIYPFYSLVGEKFADVNDSSIAMRVSYGLHAVLLTGDDSALVENEILRAGVDVSAEIFKASHHGSKTANSLPFLQAVSPSEVVIQVGEGNKFGHPHGEAMEVFGEVGVRGVRRNDLDGDVEIEF